MLSQTLFLKSCQNVFRPCTKTQSPHIQIRQISVPFILNFEINCPRVTRI